MEPRLEASAGDNANRHRHVGFSKAHTVGSSQMRSAVRSTTSKAIMNRAKSSVGPGQHSQQGAGPPAHRGLSVKWPDRESEGGPAGSTDGSREAAGRKEPPGRKERAGRKQTAGVKEAGAPIHGQTANNSVMEAEAAEHAVNYHRVRRKVQEDIRKALVQNPVIRHKLQGPRVMAKDTINFLSNPSEQRSPMNGFSDDNTMDWIATKTAETSRRRAIQCAKAEDLQEYKEEQARELALFRMRKAEAASRSAYEARREANAIQARRQVANQRIAGSIKSNEALKYAQERQEKIQRAKDRHNGRFTARGLCSETFSGT